MGMIEITNPITVLQVIASSSPLLDITAVGTTDYMCALTSTKINLVRIYLSGPSYTYSIINTATVTAVSIYRVGIDSNLIGLLNTNTSPHRMQILDWAALSIIETFSMEAGKSGNAICFTSDSEYLVGVASGSHRVVVRDVVCNPSCTTCRNSTTTGCLSCGGANYLRTDGSCQGSCAASEYISGPTTCALCDAGCLACATTATSCTACPGTNKLDGTSCVANCPSGKWDNSGTCDLCSSPCSSCSGSSTNCDSCIPGRVLLGNLCDNTTCPDGKLEVSGVCDPCDISCPTCSGTPTTCTTCIGALYLSSGSCLASCPVSYFKNIANNECT